MRMIDADALVAKMNLAIALIKNAMKNFDLEDDPECQMELKAYQDIRNGIKEEPTIEPAPQWIPCSERLPEDEYVLISKKSTKISGNKWSVAIAIRTEDPRSRKIQWRDSGFGVIQDDKVLAWMPLPEPYQPENEE